MNPARLWHLIEHTVATGVIVGVVFLIGRTFLISMHRKGQVRREYHGRFVWYWMLLGSFVGMAVAPWVADPSAYGGVFGTTLLVGWAVGTVHGFIMLAFVGPPSPPQTPPDPDGG